MENPYYLPRPKQLQIAKILLEQKANPNVPPMNTANPQVMGYTPLGAGAITGGRPMVELLLKAGALVNGRGVDGWAPLMTAVAYGETETAAYLLSKGADPDLQNRLGKTARDYAQERLAKEPKIGREMVSLLQRKAASK
jgi:ankyrin repeat protein